MVKETASTRNATIAARNTGSRGSPRIVLAPPPSPPLFGILILIATVSTHPDSIQTIPTAKRFESHTSATLDKSDIR